jgi:hypothetical protein
MKVSGQATAVLLAMRGRLFGRLDQDAPFLLDQGWSDPVPHCVVEELHEAGFIEIDETAPAGDPYVFRISATGMSYLDSIRSAPD